MAKITITPEARERLEKAAEKFMEAAAELATLKTVAVDPLLERIAEEWAASALEKAIKCQQWSEA